MTTVQLPIAVRAYAVPAQQQSPRRMKNGSSGWRFQEIGGRVLIFDAETTDDQYQNLQIGSFLMLERANTRHYPSGYRVARVDPPRPSQGLILGDALTRAERKIVQAYASYHPVQIVRNGYARWESRPVLSRDEWVHEIFFPEVYELGSLCIGYNLGFDLVRFAVRCTVGRKRNRNAFRLELCEHTYHPAIYLQVLSNKQAFIKFAPVPPPLGRKTNPGRVTFQGRFLDLREAVYGVTGEPRSLTGDCEAFGVESGKLPLTRFGVITSELIDYNRHDVEVLTSQLFIAVQESLVAYTDIITSAIEFDREIRKKRVTEIYSPASIGKAHLDAMGVTPPPLTVAMADKECRKGTDSTDADSQ